VPTKLAIWVLFGFGVTGLAFWFITSPLTPKNPFIEIPIIALFGLPSVGAFWMLYNVVRHEKHPLGYILLAFIPFTFLWYYFDRIKHRKSIRQE
jgi:hypothetical protein